MKVKKEVKNDEELMGRESGKKGKRWRWERLVQIGDKRVDKNRELEREREKEGKRSLGKVQQKWRRRKRKRRRLVQVCSHSKYSRLEREC